MGRYPKDRYWTKEEIRRMVDLWETKTLEEVAEEMGVKTSRITYMAHQIRKAGYPLAMKRRTGYIRTLISEALGLKAEKKARK